MRVSDVDFTDSDVRNFIAEQEAGDIRSGDEYKDVLLAAMENDQVWGWDLPWAKCSDEGRLLLRPGEVSLWAGMSGHLKSAVLQQVAFWQARERKVGIQSFEMPIAAQLRRAVSQCAGCVSPTKTWAAQFADWMRGRIWFYDRLDSVPPERVLACVLYMARDLGCEFILIDCLIKVKGLARDAEREAAFMDQLMAMAKSLNVHIALVHHIRKPDKGGDAYMPNKHDVRGAGDLVDQCSTLVLVWNDKKRKRIRDELAARRKISADDQAYLDKTCDLLLHVAKQRNAPFEGRLGFYVHPSMQITEHPVRRMEFEVA